MGQEIMLLASAFYTNMHFIILFFLFFSVLLVLADHGQPANAM